MLEVLSMTIKFKGYLKNDNQLKSVDESRLEKMVIGWIDYLFVFLIIIYLFVCKDNHSFCIRLHIEVRFGFFICEKGEACYETERATVTAALSSSFYEKC